MDYDSLLRFHAQVLRWLWLADVYGPTPEGSVSAEAQCAAGAEHRPSEWEALADLMETVERMDCVLSWWPCFPSMRGAIRQLGQLCGTFRNRAHQSASILSSEDPTWVPQMLKTHLCYTDTGDPLSQDGANTLLGHEHIRKLVSARALRALDAERREVKAVTALPRWIYPPEHTYEETCRSCDAARGLGSPPTWWTAPTIAQMIRQAATLSGGRSRKGLFVNLGAREGACEPPGDLQYLPGSEAGDPANCMAAAGHGGVMVEGDDGQFASLRQLYADRRDVELLLGWVDPLGASRGVQAALGRLLGGAAGPDAVDLLKVDVDNCDCCFVEQLLLGGLRPRLIHAEVHSLIPPPVAFRPRLRQDFSQTSLSIKAGAAHLHCSLSAYLAILEPMGYRLSHLVSRDAIFVRGDIVRSFPWISSGAAYASLAWRRGYRCHPQWRTKHEEPEYVSAFSYDFRRWADVSLPPEERLAHVRQQLDCVGLLGYDLRIHAPEG